MPHHRKNPRASSLPNGCAKTEDIESMRRAMARAERVAASELRAAGWRLQRDVVRRERLVRRLTGMS